ncbi:hypothetical protein OG271_17790 [Micromonospora rifamycinica]|uniref:hypothetical protein n=1 Tax=Micromonospora rifamycinica TaxID=291594 RepID=UPI002E280355|nr:hypothetical protein [Micromonospora rifamycinica]
MPKPSSATPGDRPQSAPVGLLLPHTRFPIPPSAGTSDWHGLPPNHLAHLIRRYTNVGDVVLDLDAHPAAIAATDYLRRTPAQLITTRDGLHVRLLPPVAGRPNRPATHRPGVGVDLILAMLPHDAKHLAQDGAATAMNIWRTLLRPGGYLLVGLTNTPPQPGEFSRRATVIAAARAAGLFYHQHIPAILAPLPEHEPRTAAERPDEGDDGQRLLAGRHLPTFQNLIVFGTTATATATATGEENTRA